ncbi:PREDICTED: DNA-damage-repair/toleration protein DRT100-like [Lupinus angustifolius]|uniref:DNA-damage-repair/toleration protein DRT100-like n=1 Tax=Lupinus angustifolius TaxID=3871 RepID=UPI00092E371A|nr:PREDICTED: DNA-damage-repair/toleration protein DRT100-like [Lupinus angustifolius]
MVIYLISEILRLFDRSRSRYSAQLLKSVEVALVTNNLQCLPSYSRNRLLRRPQLHTVSPGGADRKILGYMTGTISPGIYSLSSLRILDKISGEIPVNIGSLQRLTVLNLADNAISGNIPASIVNLASLKHLDISNNRLTGAIPTDFGKAGMLSRLLLNRNQLTGSIPASIGNIYRFNSGSARVSTLNLDSNLLSGQIH